MTSLICCILALSLCFSAQNTRDFSGGAPRQNQEDIDRAAIEVRRLIESASPQDRAWAAYLIGKHGLKEFGPEIPALLTGGIGDWSADLVVRAALDAAIQLDLALPADCLMSLYSQEKGCYRNLMTKRFSRGSQSG